MLCYVKGCKISHHTFNMQKWVWSESFTAGKQCHYTDIVKAVQVVDIIVRALHGII